VIPDTRHFTTVDKPEDVNAALAAFLERHRGSTVLSMPSA
jgi:pimeloyl-ACP methyl ester carboxylesterase